MKWTVGILALIQAAFTAFGAANGSLGAVALNKHRIFTWVLLLITVGFLLTLLGLVRIRGGFWSRAIRGGVLLGLLLVIGGIGLTAYAAIVAPIERTSPTVDIEVVSTDPLTIAGEVTATGIKRGVTFQVKAEGYAEHEERYHYEPPMLYHAVLGSNSAGEVKSRFRFVVPPGKYDAVGVDAWSERKKAPGACGVQKQSGNFAAKEARRVGCAIVHVTGIGVGRSTLHESGR